MKNKRMRWLAAGAAGFATWAVFRSINRMDIGSWSLADKDFY